MTTPLLRELRNSAPKAHITLVVQPLTFELVETCPYTDEVLVFDSGRRRDPAAPRSPWRAIRYALRFLMPRRFDLVLLPRWDVDLDHAAYLAYFSCAPRRMGFSETVTAGKAVANRGYDRLLSDALGALGQGHEVERNLALLRAAGGAVVHDELELWTTPEDHATVDHLLDERGIGQGLSLVALSPSGGNQVLKEWPADRYAKLAGYIRSELGAVPILVGGPSDRSLTTAIRELCREPVVSFIGDLTLRQTSALLGRCTAFVGNDNGVMHMATACGKPVVALFGASCPHRFGPWSACATVIANPLPCGPCAHSPHRDRCESCVYPQAECMRGIGVERVTQALHAALMPSHTRERAN